MNQREINDSLYDRDVKNIDCQTTRCIDSSWNDSSLIFTKVVVKGVALDLFDHWQEVERHGFPWSIFQPHVCLHFFETLGSRFGYLDSIITNLLKIYS